MDCECDDFSISGDYIYGEACVWLAERKRDWKILREASGFKSVGFWDGISGPDNAERNATQNLNYMFQSLKV